MTARGEIRINGRLPILKKNNITGIGLSASQAETVKDCFQDTDYKYVDIESALRSMSPALAEYAFPGASLDALELDARSIILRFIELPTDGPCLIRKDKDGICCIPWVDGSSLMEYAYQFKKETVSFRASNPCISYDRLESVTPDVRISSRKTVMADECLVEQEQVPLEPETALDSQALEVLAAIDKIQKKYGISLEQLDLILSYKVKLSHLHITRNGRIILTDFGDKEVKMDTLSKSLFFLYLKHPEGIRFKDLSDHKKELEDIYMSITGRGDLDEIEKSINDLVDPFSNSANVKCSRIKAAFKNVVADRIAHFYYIDGPAGSAKNILLGRSYVIWE